MPLLNPNLILEIILTQNANGNNTYNMIPKT